MSEAEKMAEGGEEMTGGEEESRGAGGLDKNSDMESTVESDVPSKSSDGGSPDAFPVLHLVHCRDCGNRYVNLSDPNQKMCFRCRVQDGSQISFRPASRVSQNDKWINYPRVRHHDREEYETRPRPIVWPESGEEEFETFRELSKPLAMTGEEIGDAIQFQEKAFIPKLRTCCLSFVNEAHLPTCRKMTDLVKELSGEQKSEQVATLFEILCERIELLAERWMDESRRSKEAHDATDRGTQNDGFRRSTWQRYVDYERRATELRNVVKYLPAADPHPDSNSDPR